MSYDSWAFSRFYKIKQYTEGVKVVAKKHNQGILINDKFLMAKKKPRFRPLGYLFWAKYTPKKLGEALKTGKTARYYVEMLHDEASADNPLNTGVFFSEWAKKDYGKDIAFRMAYDKVKKLSELMKRLDIDCPLDDLEDCDKLHNKLSVN
jgi:hypothetical protein